jgi:hypothetical protein
LGVIAQLITSPSKQLKALSPINTKKCIKIWEIVDGFYFVLFGVQFLSEKSWAYYSKIKLV